ncbi:MAG TPA: PKD domain-containing protein [Thermoanaerobaculia bacterium]|nr:PKD domain-containing protein [Thermoanaerobaculia bacterium]
MKRAGFVLGLGVLVLLLGAASASAQTANFQGNCPVSGSTVNCQFDAQRGGGSSCPASFIWKYSWDYGDGTGSGLTGSSVVNHSYPAPGAGAYQVTLTVICWDGAMPTRTRWMCISFGVPGCILVNNGWN